MIHLLCISYRMIKLVHYLQKKMKIGSLYQQNLMEKCCFYAVDLKIEMPIEYEIIHFLPTLSLVLISMLYLYTYLFLKQNHKC